MSDLPPQQRYVPPSRRRDKPILSCNLCRRRKLKCDRQSPCKTCVDRGLSLSCTYSRNVSSPIASPASHPGPNVHDRINQLEKLVTSLLAEKNNGDRRRTSALSSTLSPVPSRLNDGCVDAEAPETPVHITLETDETQYTDSGHWMSILDSVAELKGELDQIASEPSPTDEADIDTGPELLFGIRGHPTRQDILASLPPKAEADMLLERYWRFVDVAPTIMHKPKFLREYNDFWKAPNETPIMWIGVLYGLFAIAIRVQSLIEEHDAGIADPSKRTFSQARQDLYRQKIAQCLRLGNYIKCPPYTMEAFLSYFVVEYLQSRDTQHGIWLLVGMLVRTAFRMGLHREPTKLAENGFSPFEAEMRRRTWSMIVRLDLMASGQVGLPRMIYPFMSDTSEPGNYLDEDIHEDMEELPPSRPDTEYTPMLYTIVRNRVLKVVAKVVDLMAASEQPTYRDVLELNKEIRSTYDEVPEALRRWDPHQHRIFEQGSMSILILRLTFLRALEMLHRPFLFLARDERRYESSRTACIDAALEALDIQNTLEIRSQENKDMWSAPSLWWTSSWRLSSLMNHDFLLATTILVLDLDRDLKNPIVITDEPRERFKSGKPSRAEIVHSLSRVYKLWDRSSSKSREAKRVAAAVKHVLSRAGANGFTPTSTNENTPVQTELSFESLGGIPDPSFFFDPQDQSLLMPTEDMELEFSQFGDAFDWSGFTNNYSMAPAGENMGNYFG